MSSKDDNKFNEKKMITIAMIALIIIASFAVIFLVIPELTGQDNNPGGPTYSSTFTNISSEAAYSLINSSENVIIIDVRPCSCNYNAKHIGQRIDNVTIFEAILPPDDYAVFHNETSDFIIYDQDGGDTASDFCYFNLVNKVYGKIYYLRGGFNEWNSKGYPTIIPN